MQPHARSLGGGRSNSRDGGEVTSNRKKAEETAGDAGGAGRRGPATRLLLAHRYLASSQYAAAAHGPAGRVSGPAVHAAALRLAHGGPAGQDGAREAMLPPAPSCPAEAEAEPPAIDRCAYTAGLVREVLTRGFARRPTRTTRTATSGCTATQMWRLRRPRATRPAR